MNSSFRVLILLAVSGMTVPCQAIESVAQRGAPIAEFLDAQDRLNLPQGNDVSFDPSEVAPQHASAPERLVRTDRALGLARFLDETGRLIVPPGFSGSPDPAGYRLVSGDGEALRFTLGAVAGGNAASGE